MINMSSGLKEILGENPSLENLVKTRKALLVKIRIENFRDLADDLFVIETLIREKENNDA
mgnify:CR=1 FL=1